MPFDASSLISDQVLIEAEPKYFVRVGIQNSFFCVLNNSSMERFFLVDIVKCTGFFANFILFVVYRPFLNFRIGAVGTLGLNKRF